MTRIPIEEEYGYRHWIWETPDTFESAKARFDDVVSDENFSFMHPNELDLGGEWIEVEYADWQDEVKMENISGHLHESDDSWILRVIMEEV